MPPGTPTNRAKPYSFSLPWTDDKIRALDDAIAVLFQGVAKVPATNLNGFVNLTTQVTGVLPVLNGGTGFSLFNLGDILYGNAGSGLSTLSGNITTTQKFLAQTGTGSLSAAPSWQLPPNTGSLVFFFYNTASDIGGGYLVEKTPASTGAAQVLTFAGLGVGDTTLESFATLSGVPNLTFMPSGVCTCYITAHASHLNQAQLYATFYKRTTGGVETLLATSALTPQLTLSDAAYIFQGAIPSSVVLFASDRLVTKVVARTNHVVDVIITVEGVTAARAEMPSATVDATNFVPYSGATANVDLGSKTLTTTGAMNASTLQLGTTFSFPGLSGDLVVNRGGISPGTGAIYFGNTNGNFIFFDGVKFSFQQKVFSNGGFLTPTGVVSDLVGGLQLGPVFTFPGTDGDLVVNRGGVSPGTGFIYFGNTAGSHFMGFDGTNINFTDPLTAITLVNTTTAAAINASGILAIQTPNNGSDSLRLGSGGFYFGFSRSNSTGSLYIQGNQGGANNIDLAPTSGMVGIGAEPTTLFSVIEKFQVNSSGYIPKYKNIATVGLGVPAFYGLDNRTGLTTADGAAITLYTTIAAGNVFRVSADIFATAAVTGTATYTVTWTEHSTTQTISVVATAINVNGTANAIIRPDNGTVITAQLTGVFTGTFSVCAPVEQIA